MTSQPVYHNGTATDIQRNAFTYFLQEAAPSLERNFGSNEWLQLVLRTSNELPMVFSAVTAVGCMVHARSQILMTDHALTQLKTGLEEETALSQYCEATCRLQKYIDAAVLHGADIEPVLICSLLFVLFETFRGEPMLASSHLRHGRRALQSAVLQSERADLRNKSSSSQLATKKLLSTFDTLDGGITPPGLAVEPGQTRQFSLDDELLFRSNSIDDAKQALDALVVETSRYRDQLLLLAQDHLCNDDHRLSNVAGFNCVKHCLSRSIDTAEHPIPSNRWNQLVRAHKQWLSRLHSLATDTPHQSLRLLRIQHFYSYFLILTSRDTTEGRLTHLDNEFTDILKLTEQYLDCNNGICVGPTKPASWERQSSFSLEPGPLSVLFLISLNCRNAGLKSRAMNLLRNANRREGLQWSGELSIYADCINEFEDARAESLNSEGYHRPLDWWFERIPVATNRPRLAVQGSGHHEIRVYGCRYLGADCKALELVELGASGVPPLHLQELSRKIFSVPMFTEPS